MNRPKILYLDIENAPNLGYVWGKYDQNVLENVTEWYMLSFAYKWEGDKTVRVRALPDFPLYKKDKENDLQLVGALHDLLEEADVVIAHNGDRFDLPKINARLVTHGFRPPSPYKTIDTLKVARAKFKFTSNRLDDIAKYLNIGRKLPHTGFNMWKGCMMGDFKAWSMMKAYNKQDIVLLEEVYRALRPWMTNHPNMNIFDEQENACPVCRSKKIQRRGFSITQLGKKQRIQCQNLECGAWSHGKIEKTKIEIR